jgi:hypothetical protein
MNAQKAASSTAERSAAARTAFLISTLTLPG